MGKKLLLAVGILILAATSGMAVAAEDGRGSISITNKRTGETRRVVMEQTQANGLAMAGVRNGIYSQEQVRHFSRVFGKLPPGMRMEALSQARGPE